MQVWLPFPYRGTYKRQRLAQMVPTWVVESAPFDIPDLDISGLEPVIAMQRGEHRIAWYRDGNVLLRPVLDAEGHPATLDALSAPDDVTALVLNGTAFLRHVNAPQWDDHPMFLDAFHMPRNERIANPPARRDDIEASVQNGSRFRTWTHDERDNGLERAHSIAKGLRLVDGILMRPAPEPAIRIAFDRDEGVVHLDTIVPPISDRPEDFARGNVVQIFLPGDAHDAARACAESLLADADLVAAALTGEMRIEDRLAEVVVHGDVDFRSHHLLFARETAAAMESLWGARSAMDVDPMALATMGLCRAAMLDDDAGLARKAADMLLSRDGTIPQDGMGALHFSARERAILRRMLEHAQAATTDPADDITFAVTGL